MRLEAIVMPVACLMCIGCWEQRNSASFDAEIDQCIETLLTSEQTGASGYRHAVGFLNGIASMTNATVRADKLRAFSNALVSAAASKRGYRQWCAYLTNVAGLARIYCCVLSHVRADVEDEYDFRLLLVAYFREQLAMLRPTRMIVPKDATFRDEEWRDWYYCYNHAFSSYRYEINDIELRFERDTKALPEERRAKLKAKIEQCLGRPMKTREAVLADKNWETEEYKGVRTYSLAP